MLRSLTSGVSGMQQFQQQMDVIGNNIANVNTVGYKASRAEFADTLSQTLTGNVGNGSMQVGTGVTTGAITSLFTPGTVAGTTSDTDLAITGEGFFVVRDPGTGNQYATRAGEFRIDSNSGYLITSQGARVQGFTDSSLGTRGDIQIDANIPGAAAGVTVASFSFDKQGKISVRLSDGSGPFVRGQVLLQEFRIPWPWSGKGTISIPTSVRLARSRKPPRRAPVASGRSVRVRWKCPTSIWRASLPRSLPPSAPFRRVPASSPPVTKCCRKS